METLETYGNVEVNIIQDEEMNGASTSMNGGEWLLDYTNVCLYGIEDKLKMVAPSRIWLISSTEDIHEDVAVEI